MIPLADLNSLYQSNGLQGILPYSFGMQGSGYRFLCDKLREGEVLYLTVSPFNNMPWFFPKDDRVLFHLYTDPLLAEQQCDLLAREKLQSAVINLDLTGIADHVWRRYRDLGATHLLIDDSIYVAMSDLTPPASYDGFINPKAPLRNDRLNAALYTLLQYENNDLSHPALKGYFWDVFKQSRLYIPLKPLRQLQPGEILTADNSAYHYADFEGGMRGLLVFTDAYFVELYANLEGLTPDQYTANVVCTYDTLLEYMLDNRDEGVILNYGAGNFPLDLDSVDEFDSLALTAAAQNAADVSSYCV